jgi:hypothetical protein
MDNTKLFLVLVDIVIQLAKLVLVYQLINANLVKKDSN